MKKIRIAILLIAGLAFNMGLANAATKAAPVKPQGKNILWGTKLGVIWGDFLNILWGTEYDDYI